MCCGFTRIYCGSHVRVGFPQYIHDHPQYLLHRIYVVTHNTLPTLCCPHYIPLSSTICCPPHVTHNIYICAHNMYPQHVEIYILWVYIVGASVYVVDHIFHYVPHNIIVLSTIYTEPVYVVDNIPLSPTTHTHNIYKVPTIYTHNIYRCIYCGYILWVIFVYIVGATSLYILWVRTSFTDV